MTNREYSDLRKLLDSLNIEDLCLVKAMAEVKIFEIDSETPEFAIWARSFEESADIAEAA